MVLNQASKGNVRKVLGFIKSPLLKFGSTFSQAKVNTDYKIPSPAPCPKPNVAHQTISRLKIFQPRKFDPSENTWVTSNYVSQQALRAHSVLRLFSWNLYFGAFARERATTAMKYLQKTLTSADNTVIMLQEVRKESLEAILADKWIQANFTVSDIKPVEQRLTHYFTLMLISKHIPIRSCFRVPLLSAMGRDALVIDVPVEDKDKHNPSELQPCIRLCTTHLESLSDTEGIRMRQLSVISAMLKGAPAIPYRLFGGIVGGDMNSTNKLDQTAHRRLDVNLQDAFQIRFPPRRGRNDKEKGQIGGTYGCQPGDPRSGTRLDKFLYTQGLETVVLEDLKRVNHDIVGRVCRFGIGLTTEANVEHPEPATNAKQSPNTITDSSQGHTTTKSGTKILVSDHVGIAVGVRVWDETRRSRSYGE